MPDHPSAVFEHVAPEIDFPADERRILSFWRAQHIFERSLEQRRDAPSYVFYEGPPTANGLPHNGHVLTRVIKDLFPRYKTMRGFYVPRKAGWDTHGLPVEVEVEKELRIHGKSEIERFGVEPFIQRCVESVFRYTNEWERLTNRIGYWVDLADAYVTYHRSYVESVWWALAELHRKGLLYRGHKIVWWWPQGGTALSAGEVGMGYRTVDDPSIYVAFPLRDEPDTALLIWTTTPWTLPSNMYAAVCPTAEYVIVYDGRRKFIVAASLRDELARTFKTELSVVGTRLGRELVGLTYEPPYDVFFERTGDEPLPVIGGGTAPAAWRVVGADFVTLENGTGVVHIAPAFGEDDYEVFVRERARFEEPDAVTLASAVEPDGTFSDAIPYLAGRFCKDADKDIQRELRSRGLLVHAELYRHEYPYCWRADDDPLIQFARPAWYIRTTAAKQQVMANNRSVNWIPDHIKEGRFGNFLANNVDWALSRERYWGTPLPLWVNSESGEVEAIPSLQFLREKHNNNLAEVEAELRAFLPQSSGSASVNDLIIHKPWIDKVTYEHPGQPGRFVRVPEVVDAWFDSGCMPFAQWGFPHLMESREQFARAFPADFIAEAIDQTRGWFYSLMMVSTLLFDEETNRRENVGLSAGDAHPFRNCIVLGHVADKEGKKESKSKGNYTPPEVILDEIRLEFAVLDDSNVDLAARPGCVLIGRQDLEGLDLREGSCVDVFRPDKPEVSMSLRVSAHPQLKRRVALLAEQDLDALGVSPSARGADVLPVEVPRLSSRERVVVRDPSSRAPGADAFRWFFYAASPTWSNTRHSLSNVRLFQKDFQVKLRNVYTFFTIYANIDGFSPAVTNSDSSTVPWLAIRESSGWRNPRSRTVLDRWMLSELHLAVRDVGQSLDQYHVFDAAQALVRLVDGLSNWYVRRSRDRFWASGMNQDKSDAYYTLYEVLVTISALSAPFIPFFSEVMWLNLVRRPWPVSQPPSVHLSTYPDFDPLVVDDALSAEMSAVRALVSLGLAVRMNDKIKVRQPLARADIILAQPELRERLMAFRGLIADELNVREVHFVEPGQELGVVQYKVRPDLRAVGKRLGAKVSAARLAFAAADGGALYRQIMERGLIKLRVDDAWLDFSADEVQVQVQANPGYAAAGAEYGVVALHTELTDSLVDEGLVRELLARVQSARKALSLEYTQRVRVWLDGDARLQKAARESLELLAQETLADEFRVGPEGFTGEEEVLSVNGRPARIRVERSGG